jgi:peptide/nickel transport system substrate-binding protein
MKRFRWQLIIIFLTGIVIGALLLIEQPGTKTYLTQPNAGGTYTEGLIGSFDRLNPLLDAYNPVDRDVDRLIFSRLFTFDSRGLPQGDLAESWGISKDGTIYNINIHSDVLWHDGQPLTTADIAFTVDLIKNGGAIIPVDLQQFWSSIEVITPSPTLIQFILPEPYAPFFDYLSFGILPEHILKGVTIDQLVNDPFNLQPIGSGPYKFDHLIVGQGQINGLILTANDTYFIRRPYINEIDFRYYPDDLTALNAYREGKVQGISDIGFQNIREVSDEPDLAIYSARKPDLAIVLFNLSNPTTPYFQDEVVRKALYMAIDRQAMINTLFNGQAVIADGPIFADTWAYYDGTPRVDFDLEAAKNLLIEDGYIVGSGEDAVRTKDDTGIVFTLLYPDDDYHLQIAQYIQSNWEALDIRVEIQAVPYDELISSHLGAHDFQAALVDLNFDRSPDPDPYPFWDQATMTGGQNYSQWDNRLVSEYLENARITDDIAIRARLYYNFQVVFSKELPALPLFYPVYSYAVSQQVQGVSIGPMFDSSDRFATILDWYLVSSPPSSVVQQTTPSP